MKRWRVERLGELGAEMLLGEAVSHHLLVVCRHPRGQPLVLFDGDGLEVEAVLSGVEQERAKVRITSAPRPARARPALHLVLGIPKGPALDNAVRMAVEVGATHIHPATTERTIPRGDHQQRWERIAVAAAQQCGRADVPRVDSLAPLREVIARLPADLERFLALPHGPEAIRAAGPAALAVGPEGGFGPREVELLLGSGWTAVDLGPWILRVDTAVAVGLYAIRPL